MTISCSVWGDLVFVEVPRSGTTSVRASFEPQLAELEDREVHHAGPDKVFCPDVWTLHQWLEGPWRTMRRFTIVRDPVARLESYYYSFRESDHLPDDVNAFIADLPEWMRDEGPNPWPPHIYPQTALIGERLDLFDFVGHLEDLGPLEDWLGRKLPHRFASPKDDRRELTIQSRIVIDAIYRRDFDVLGYPRPI